MNFLILTGSIFWYMYIKFSPFSVTFSCVFFRECGLCVNQQVAFLDTIAVIITNLILMNTRIKLLGGRYREGCTSRDWVCDTPKWALGHISCVKCSSDPTGLLDFHYKKHITLAVIEWSNSLSDSCKFAAQGMRKGQTTAALLVVWCADGPNNTILCTESNK